MGCPDNIKILFVTPKLPRKDSEIAYSFIKDEIGELTKTGFISPTIFEFDYKGIFRTIGQLPKVLVVSSSIEIIHAHFVIPYGFIGSIINEILGKPLVITIHGFDILVDKDLRYGINRNSLIRLLTKFTLFKSHRVIANSRALKRECARYNVPPSKVTVIPYGIDLQIFYPMTSNALEEKLPAKLMKILREWTSSVKILCPKRLEKIYGIEYLIKAVKILNERGLRNIRIICVGGGTCAKEYRLLINQMGLSKNVMFLRTVPRKIMPLLYNICDFTVVPSLVEGFGLVVAESLACGKPVIGTSVGGILDQIIDGFNGFLVPPRDALSLANKMQILIQEERTRRIMSNNARIFAESYLDLRKRISSIISLYRNIVEDNLKS